MDSTIPRQYRSGHPYGPTSGQFVRISAETVVLRDRANNSWPLDQVSICHGGWGFDTEGVAKLPRPAEYNAAGEETVLGDRVLILFLEGSRRRPVVVPGFRRIQASALDFLPYNHGSPAAADPNRLAARVQPLDDEGSPTGSVDLEAGFGQKAAVRLSVGPADGGGPRTYVALDDEDGAVQLATKGGAVIRLAPGQCAIVSEEGHTFVLDADNGVQIAAKDGTAADPMLSLNAGLLQILSTLTQIVGRLELTTGLSTTLSPLLVQGTAGAGLYFDLSAVLLEVAAIGAAITPSAVLTPNTSAMQVKLTAELSNPGTIPGYGSSVAKSTG